LNNINLLLNRQGLGRKSNTLLTKNGKKYFQFKNKMNFLNDAVVKNIIEFLNSVKTKKIKLPVFLDIGQVTVADKLSYIVLECLVYEMLNLGYSVTVKFYPNSNIDTRGINNSPLRHLNECWSRFSSNKNYRESKFRKEFNSITDGRKYRRMISPKSNSYLSKLTSSLILFLKNQFEFSESCRKIEYDEIMVIKLANTIGELVGNATEHGEGDCLLDIDITHNFTHSKKQGRTFGAVNIALVNFSDTNFGDKVKKKILNTDLSKSIRYQKTKVAYDIHQQSYFNDNYNEEHFWNLASLQDKISGRPDNYNNGGKGMTDLIKSIQNFTHEDYCYMMSGKEILKFKKELLKQDSDGFIGFNKTSFLQSGPETTTLAKSKVYLPGVAYNLNFILEEV
jgi:two-component sensor histidine kinase